MKVTMLLADAAQAVDNKLYILGGGWSITGPAPTPMAFALKIEVPWNDTNRKYQLRLILMQLMGPVSALVLRTHDINHGSCSLHW